MLNSSNPSFLLSKQSLDSLSQIDTPEEYQKELDSILTHISKLSKVIKPNNLKYKTERKSLADFLIYGHMNNWIKQDELLVIKKLASKAGLTTTSYEFDPEDRLNDIIVTLAKEALDESTFSRFVRNQVKNVYSNIPGLSSILKQYDEILDSPINWAIQHHHTTALKILIRTHPNLNQVNEKGESFLHLAIRYNHMEAIKALIEAKVDLNQKNNKEDAPLHLAIRFKNTEAVKALINAKADIHEKGKDRVTPLHLAIRKNHIEAVKALIEAKADLNQKNGDGDAALHVAIRFKNTEAVKVLIEAKADLNQKDWFGRHPLYLAISSSTNTEILKVLINAKVDLDQKDWGTPPIHLAIYSNNIEAVKALIEAKADLNQKDRGGTPPIHLAIYSNNIEAVKALIEAKADLNQTDDRGYTPLHYAVHYKNYKACKLLIKHGAKNTLYKDMTPYLMRKTMITDQDSLEYKKMSKIKFPKEIVLHGKAYLSSKMIGHAFELKGETELVLNEAIDKVELEGGIPRYFWKKFAQHIANFTQSFPDLMTHQTAETLQSICKRTSIKKEPGETLIEHFLDWRDAKPIILNSGFQGGPDEAHYVSFLVWKNQLIVCNRGAAGNHLSYQAFKCPESLSFESADSSSDRVMSLLGKIGNLYERNKKEYLDFIASLTPDEELTTAFSKFNVPLQRVGNCGWANSEGILLPLLIVNQCIQNNPDLELLDADKMKEVSKQQKKVFDNLNAAHRLTIIKKYIQKVKNKEFVPDFALLLKVFHEGPSHTIDGIIPEIIVEWGKIENEIRSLLPLDLQPKQHKEPQTLSSSQSKSREVLAQPARQSSEKRNLSSFLSSLIHKFNDKINQLLFFHYLSKGDLKKVNAFIDKRKLDLDHITKNGKTPLQYATKLGQMHIVEALISAGIK